ncbi:MAG: hypothetical protein HY070_01670, partial [Chloroflexi bacterium]|nr:hypothetical protein [Chloroflexota bacterium]
MTDKGHHVQVVCVDHYAPVKNYSVETILFSNGANQQFDVPFNFPCFTTHP